MFGRIGQAQPEFSVDGGLFTASARLSVVYIAEAPGEFRDLCVGEVSLLGRRPQMLLGVHPTGRSEGPMAGPHQPGSE